MLTLNDITLARRQGGHLQRAGTVLHFLPNSLLPARVLDPASYVLPRVEGAWVDHGTHCCRGLLARQQVQLCWVLSLAVRTLQVQEIRELFPPYLIAVPPTIM